MEKIQQKTSDKTWYDEVGQAIPVNRVTKIEKLFERQSAKLLKGAVGLHQKLADFKTEITQICQEAYLLFMKDKGLNPKSSKGNFTWYNFNRSIKVEVNINELIDFDDLGIQAAKEVFSSFLNENVQSKDQFIKQMVLDAFETSRGKLDAKKIFGLIRYKSKIKNQRFQEAVKLLEESIRRPKSRTYFRVSKKNSSGKYEVIDLNFSSI